MTNWERTGGFSIPAIEEIAARQVNEALPETRVKITMEVEGGTIPEGQKVTIEIKPLVLQLAQQLRFDIMEEEPEDIDWDTVIRLEQGPRKVNLSIDMAHVPSEHETIFTVKYTDEEGILRQVGG